MKKVWSLLLGLLLIAVSVMMLQNIPIPEVTIPENLSPVLGAIAWVILVIALLNKKAEAVDSLAVMVLTVVAVLAICRYWHGRQILPMLTGKYRNYAGAFGIVAGVVTIIISWLPRGRHRE